MGTWDHPEKGRLIMRCDYCNTPWHLDCIPEVPRASLKNIGLKWKCPLHAVQTTKKRRRLTRNQEYIEPVSYTHLDVYKRQREDSSLPHF